MNEGHLFEDDDEYFRLNDEMRLQELYGIDRNHRNPQASAPPETEQVLADCNKEMGDQKKPAPGTDVIKDVATSGVAIGKKALVRVERVMGPQIGSLSADRQQGAQIGSLSQDRQRKVIFEVDPKNKRKIKASFGECIHDKDILVLLHLLDEFAREYRHYRSESDYHTELQEHADKALSWALEDSSQTGDDIAFSKLAWFDRANTRAIDINIQHFLEKMGHTKKSAASGKARADLLNSLEALASIRLFPTDGITTLSCSFLDFAYVNPRGKRTSKGYMRIVCNPFTVTATLSPEKGCSVNIDLVAAREIYKHGPKGALFLYHQLCTRVNAGSWSAHGYNMDTLARYIYHDFADKKQQKKIYHRITNVKNCIKCLVKAGWKFVWTEDNKIKIYRPKDTYCLAQ